MDFYRVLELNRYATQEEIRGQYRKLSLHFHPDKNIQEDEEHYRKYQNILTTVYKVLTDLDLKQIYDVCGYNAVREKVQNEKFVEEYWGFWRFYNAWGRQRQERFRNKNPENPEEKELRKVLHDLYVRQQQKKKDQEQQQYQKQQQQYEQYQRQQQEQQQREHWYRQQQAYERKRQEESRQQQQAYEEQKRREQEAQYDYAQWDQDYYYDQDQEYEEEVEIKEEKRGRKKKEREYDENIDIGDINQSTLDFVRMQKEKLGKQKKTNKIQIDRKKIEEKGEIEYVEYVKELCRECKGTNSKEKRRPYCECVKEQQRCGRCQNGFKTVKRKEVCEACRGGIIISQQKIHVCLEKMNIK